MKTEFIELIEKKKQKKNAELQAQMIKFNVLGSARKAIMKKLGPIALSVVMAGGIVSAGEKLYDHNKVNKNDIRYDQIVEDINIHANTGLIEDGNGKRVTIHTPHACAAPRKAGDDTYYADRLANVMEGQYSQVVIDETIEQFDILVDDDSSKEEKANAQIILEQIEDSLYKDEDGLWNTNIVFDKVKTK